MLNIRPYDNKEQLLFPPSIGDYLSKKHVAHVVDEAVEEIDLEPYYKKISPVGNPPYHPALMIKICFYGYITKTYSSRKIEEKIHTDVAFIYLSGMQKPDFKAISEFRRKNIEELRNSFVDILQICHCLGMTQLGNISIDSNILFHHKIELSQFIQSSDMVIMGVGNKNPIEPVDLVFYGL